MVQNDPEQQSTPGILFGINKNTQTIKKILEEHYEEIKNKLDDLLNETSEVKKQNQELERKLKMIWFNQIFWN